MIASPLAMVALPVFGAALLFFGRRLSRRACTAIAVAAVASSGAVALALAVHDRVGEHVGVAAFGSSSSLEFGLSTDPLAFLMAGVITGVGTLIHVYAGAYMRDDEEQRRFLATMNLFVAFMLVLVLAGDFVTLYVGWEGVGLCSYLLIGFWYEDASTGKAALKAFLVTRAGDVALLIAFLLLFSRFGTLDIAAVLERARAELVVGDPTATLAAALLLVGAMGKSAQVPLQVWLPDAMAGPTPASALIHAATMVTAGVYLIARTHVLFVLAPAVLTAVAVVGAITLLLAGLSAAAQRDIKRVLAYSTVSQLGYMFLGLGVGAWGAALFHLLTHAVFKAMLFLGAGVVIERFAHERDLTKMGGLRTRAPTLFLAFVAGGGALAGLPLVTSGFYSKEWILGAAWSSPAGSPWLWAAGIAGTFVTGLYITRLVVLVFIAPARTEAEPPRSPSLSAPVYLLAAGAVVLGFLETPSTLGGIELFRSFLGPGFEGIEGKQGEMGTELALQGAAAAASLAGIAWAWRRYRGGYDRLHSPGPLARAAYSGWGFDAVYSRVIVRPFVALARALRDDPMDRSQRLIAFVGAALARWNARDFMDAFVPAVSRAATWMHDALRVTQSGRLRDYSTAILVGAAFLLGYLVLS